MNDAGLALSPPPAASRKPYFSAKASITKASGMGILPMNRTDHGRDA
ncbi:MAG: hypothetical protein SGI98_03215 [Verrucomicrobiota bacterium]|nr:hypothetical protein [Verrucomicrobiota bacterium]